MICTMKDDMIIPGGNRSRPAHLIYVFANKTKEGLFYENTEQV